MSEVDIVRAWKDPEYRQSLTNSQHTLLPDNPAGIIELSDWDLEQVAGGTNGCNQSFGEDCVNSNDCVSAVCSGNICIIVDPAGPPPTVPPKFCPD